MKKVLLYTILFLFTLNHHPVMSKEHGLNPALLEEIESKTLRPFFNALKSGNVEVIKRYMTGPMYEEYRVLLDENKDYPGLLREHYKDAVFSVERGISLDNRVVVDYSIQFPGGARRVSQYILQEQEQEQEQKSGSGQQSAGERLWRISEQRIDQVR